MYIFFIILFLLNISLIFFFKKFSTIINIFDVPDGKRKIHKKPIASIGGFFIFINLFIYFIFKQYNFFFLDVEVSHLENLNFFIFFVFSALFFLMGYIDDKYNLNANVKLILFSIFIFIFLFFSESIMLFDLRFSFLKNSIDIHPIRFPLLTLCILLYLNAFNMFDGINLQSSFYAINIFFLFILHGIFIDLSFVMILSLIFFSYLNFKNKCFLGNNGSLLIAFIISYLFIKSQNTQNFFFADQIFLAMQVPGLDLLRLTIQRILNHKHPFHSDRNHIHHLLIKKLGYKKSLLIIASIIIIPNYLSILYGNVLYYIVLTFCIYIFVIFKFSK
jgi:UDP-GlcNAc:undecaprenyl-phosphate GlcNAc-1-phosphate transferase